MDIGSVSCLFFSPTGTTRTVIEAIAQGLGVEKTEMLDFTRRLQRGELPTSFGDELVILAAPVYYGRVAPEAAAFLETLQGNNTPAVIVAVYGNRAFDDALLEMRDIASARGFVPFAAGAFIGEHSYSRADQPIGQDRPDAGDLAKARAFGVKLRETLDGAGAVEELTAIEVPGGFPYKELEQPEKIRQAREHVPFMPVVDQEKCTRCGDCVEACPTGAIIDSDPETPDDRWKCIVCMACVKVCPEGARRMTEPHFLEAIKGLAQRCQERREPETFF